MTAKVIVTIDFNDKSLRKFLTDLIGYSNEEIDLLDKDTLVIFLKLSSLDMLSKYSLENFITRVDVDK